MFLADQRGARLLQGVLTDRSLSLRAATSRDRADQEVKQMIRFNIEEIDRKEDKERAKKERSDKEIAELFSTVPVEQTYDPGETADSDTVDETGDDSEWEDIEDAIMLDKVKYNTMSLKHFARECDRYRISDRAGAKIGNGLLKDHGIVKEGSTSKLICPSKLRRERLKWGDKLAQAHSALQLPHGLYTDGKRVPTLVRETTTNKVQVPGRTGRSAYRSVNKTSNRLTVEDHYPVLSETGRGYVTHSTPLDGTGLALAKELVAVIQERQATIR